MKHRHAPHHAAKARPPAGGWRLWWVVAGIAVGVAGTAAALWRNADDEPRTALGVRVPGYLGGLVKGRPTAVTLPATAASQQPASTRAGRPD